MFDILETCPNELNNYKHIDSYVLDHSETAFHTLVSVIVDVEMSILAYVRVCVPCTSNIKLH